MALRRGVLPIIAGLVAALLASGPVHGEQSTAASAPGDTGVFDGDPATTGRLDADTPQAAALALSRGRFAASGARYAVLSRDDAFADSLAGAALTADGPLLFTQHDTLPTATRRELERVLPEGGTVYLLGGTAAIDRSVARAVRDAGLQTRRLAGRTRVETALAVADAVVDGGTTQEVLLARADAPAGNPTAAWADSVTGGGVAAARGMPVLVTPGHALHSAVARWLAAHGVERTYLLGGSAALSSQVERDAPGASRLGGATRTAVAARVAETLWAPQLRRFLVIDVFRADGWAYGLAAAGLAADAVAPLLAVRPDDVPGATAELVRERGGSAEVELGLMGSAAVISEEIRHRLDALDGAQDGDDVQLPDLRDRSVAEASAWLENAGLRPVSKHETGTVDATDPEAGETVEAGASVVLVAEPTPQHFSGSGDEVLGPISVDNDVAMWSLEFTATRAGGGDFRVRAYDDDTGEPLRELVEVSDAAGYEGEIVAEVPGGAVQLDVRADGDWSVTLRQPTFLRAEEIPLTVHGEGDGRTPLFVGEGEPVRVRYAHEGGGEFKVVEYDAHERRRVLVDERGSTEDETGTDLAEDRVYVLDVYADGPWTIELEPWWQPVIG